eukprot:s4190_g1.t1
MLRDSRACSSLHMTAAYVFTERATTAARRCEAVEKLAGFLSHGSWAKHLLVSVSAPEKHFFAGATPAGFATFSFVRNARAGRQVIVVVACRDVEPSDAGD